VGKEELKATLETLAQGFPPEALAVNLKGAISALGEITGDAIVEDVLDRIFEKFCVGK